MTIVTLGIDLAKNVFAIHGVDATGKPVLVRPSVPRSKLLELVASLPPCLVGMEACFGAHHWAVPGVRRYGAPDGAQARRTVPPVWQEGQVRRSRCGGDLRRRSRALRCASCRPSPCSNSPSRLCTARQGFVQQRTATINRTRGLLSKFGVELPLKAATERRERCTSWRTFPAGPTPSSATCSARSLDWTSALHSTTATSSRSPRRAPRPSSS